MAKVGKTCECFPKCSEKSHVERGFCGNSLQIAVVGHGITPEDRVFTQIVSESSTHHLEKPTEVGPITFPPPSCFEELEVKIRLNELYKGTSLTQYTDHVYANDYLCPRRLYEGHLDTCKNGKVSLNSKVKCNLLYLLKAGAMHGRQISTHTSKDIRYVHIL